MQYSKSLLGQFDFVIALGELHRYKNPLHGLHVANMLLKAKGQLLALEYEGFLAGGKLCTKATMGISALSFF